MKLFAFCTVMTLSLVYAGLTVVESLTYHKWEQTVLDQKQIQSKLAFFQRMNSILDQMLRRMAAESLHDPALARLLEENNVKVVVNGESAPNAKNPLNTSEPPAAPPPPANAPLIPDKPPSSPPPSN